MLQKILILIFISLITISSCNEISLSKKEIKNKIKNETGLIIPDFIIIDFNTSLAIGDYSENMTLKFDSLVFDTLIKQVYKTENFSYNERAIKGWKKYSLGYKFENFSSNLDDESTFYYINLEKRTLHYLNIDE